MWIQLDCVIALFERRVKILTVELDASHIASDDRRNRVQCLGRTHLFQRAVQTAHGGETGNRVPMMRGGISGVETDGALELTLGTGPIPILGGFHVRQGSVRLGGAIVLQYGRSSR